MVRHYIVSGRVQGVGFRWYVCREACALGLRGWVRNTVDGNVELQAAGSDDQISALEACLRRGSRGSRVDRIDRAERPAIDAESLPAFQIEGAW